MGEEADIRGADWYRSFFKKEKLLNLIQAKCAEKGWDFPYA
jgi:hypothetical protein